MRLPTSTTSIFLLLLSSANPEPGAQPGASPGAGGDQLTGVEQELVTRYLLSRLLHNKDQAGTERSDQDSSSSIVYPQVSNQRVSRPLRKLLDQAKDNIDVIDFRSSKHDEQPEFSQRQDDPERVAPSESVPVFLPFPGTAHNPSSSPSNSQGSRQERNGKFSMPLVELGQKKYYIGLFFKANWYKAEQYCRFHGMHLASINSAEEQDNLEDHITSFGMGEEHFWTSGTDQAEEGKFFWMANGKPITYENWNAGEPNNFVYENGEEEHCLELWNRDGKGLRWNDTPCSFETFFVCEI